MQIAGIQKMTLVDFPGHVAATIFTRGCSFRCPFCHNPELVVPEQYNPLLSERQILDFLESRFGKLTGICITGGEPCMQPDIDKFISYLKALGYDVKLDTNGSYPEKLEKIIKDGDVDYIAMDIKAPLSKYSRIAMPNSEFLISNQIPNSNNLSVISSHSEPTDGWIKEGEKSHYSSEESPLNAMPAYQSVIPDPPSVIPAKAGIQAGQAPAGILSSICHPEPEAKDLAERIKESIRLIMNSGIDYEFRTTVCHPLHEVEDFKEIGEMIKGAKRFFIQNYQHTKQVDEKSGFQPFSETELNRSLKVVQHYVEQGGLR